MESDNENNGQYVAYKQLSEETQCEAHHGHCHITHQGGSDSHYRLLHQEMTLWAKKMVSFYWISQLVRELTSTHRVWMRQQNMHHCTASILIIDQLWGLVNIQHQPLQFWRFMSPSRISPLMDPPSIPLPAPLRPLLHQSPNIALLHLQASPPLQPPA